MATHTLKHSTLRPVTIRQLVDVHYTSDDVPFQLDGQDLHRVKFIGMLTDKPPVHSDTCTVYIVQDALSSASIPVLIYHDEDTPEVDDFSNEAPKRAPKLNAACSTPAFSPEKNVYYAWFGPLRYLKKQRGNPKTHIHVEMHGVRKVTDMNELTYHGLEVVHTHLQFTHK